MRCVLKMTRRQDGFVLFAGAVANSEEVFQTLEEAIEGESEIEFSTEIFESLEAASEHPFPSEEIATEILFRQFPRTENIEYEVVAVEEHSHN